MNKPKPQLETMREASDFIISQNVESIEKSHGPGGEHPEPYHNRLHTLDVIAATSVIGELALKNDRINPTDLILLRIAASGHDVVYNPVNKSDNETNSALETISLMESYSCFTAEHLARVEKLIMATQVKEFYPRIIQSVDPNDYATGIIADADLSSFGMPFENFESRAQSYLQELRMKDSVSDDQYWNFESVILKNHKWHTQEAAQLFPHLPDNLEAIKSLRVY